MCRRTVVLPCVPVDSLLYYSTTVVVSVILYVLWGFPPTVLVSYYGSTGKSSRCADDLFYSRRSGHATKRKKAIKWGRGR